MVLREINSASCFYVQNRKLEVKAIEFASYFGCVLAINVLFAAKFGESLHVGTQLVCSTLVHN